MSTKSLVTTPGETELQRLEGEIAQRRETLIESLSELREEVVELADWHTWVRRRPLRSVLISLAAGWVLGKVIRLG